MATRAVFHGTEQDALDLRTALARNCSCVTAADGTRLSTCAPHAMLLDQRSLDHLLFSRNQWRRFWREEMQGTTTPEPQWIPAVAARMREVV